MTAIPVSVPIHRRSRFSTDMCGCSARPTSWSSFVGPADNSNAALRGAAANPIMHGFADHARSKAQTGHRHCLSHFRKTRHARVGQHTTAHPVRLSSPRFVDKVSVKPGWLTSTVSQFGGTATRVAFGGKATATCRCSHRPRPGNPIACSPAASAVASADGVVLGGALMVSVSAGASTVSVSISSSSLTGRGAEEDLEGGRCAGVCVEVEQLFERGQPVARVCAWVVAECDPFEFANKVSALGSWRGLAGIIGLRFWRWSATAVAEPVLPVGPHGRC